MKKTKNNQNIIIAIIASLLALFLFSGFKMMSYGQYSRYNMMSNSIGFGWIIMPLFIILIILAIIWLIKNLQEDK